MSRIPRAISVGRKDAKVGRRGGRRGARDRFRGPGPMDQEAQIPPGSQGRPQDGFKQEKEVVTLRRDTHWLRLGISKSKTETGNEGPVESTQDSPLSSIEKSQ